MTSHDQAAGTTAEEAAATADSWNFIANEGQVDEVVKFHARGGGHEIFFSPDEVVFRASHRAPDGGALTSVIRLSFIGAATDPILEGSQQMPGTANFFIGNDPEEWTTEVATYGEVAYRGLYPGVDLVYTGSLGHLKSAFIVAPSVDPQLITMHYAGTETIALRDDGALVLSTELGELVEAAPVVYQEVDGIRSEVGGSYRLLPGDNVGFLIDSYDASEPLVIDPDLGYSTYLGGSGDDRAIAVAVDSSGNAYVTGSAGAMDFPTTVGSFQTAYGGGGSDAYVAKVDSTGSELLFSTYIGGTGCCDPFEVGDVVFIDDAGNVYVGGHTDSADFPTTAGALQNTFGGGAYDAFIAKLDPTGSTLLYSTYLGGTGYEFADGLFVDATGIYLSGETSSAGFVTTAGSFDQTFNGPGADGYVAKLDPSGSSMLYSTFLGGSGRDCACDLAVDSAGNAYLAGRTTSVDFPTTLGAFQEVFGGGSQDNFVAKLDPSGTSLMFSTYIGGSGKERGGFIALDGTANPYVGGSTDSVDFPTTSGVFQTALNGLEDAYIAKLDATGATLVYSTLLGGSDRDGPSRLVVDTLGRVSTTGPTSSTDFPTTPRAPQATFAGVADCFVSTLDPNGTMLLYSTFLGGSEDEVCRDIAIGDAPDGFVAGYTASTDFPTTAGVFQPTMAGGAQDAFLVKLDVIGANTPPDVTSVSAPVDPVELGTEIVASGIFTDPDPGDTHTAEWDWGDTITTGTVNQTAGTVTDPHTYQEPGVYTVTLTVTDQDDDSDTAEYTFVVVYDPDGGFVTGGGTIDSPVGAYTPDPGLSGEAHFGFVSKYKKGATTPDGHTHFRLDFADFKFKSSDYEWLVIAGAKAQFKGTGTINGDGSYGFMIKTTDAELTPSTEVDLLRVKIWDKDNNDQIVYDNQLGDADDADPTTAITGGKIKIHKAK